MTCAPYTAAATATADAHTPSSFGLLSALHVGLSLVPHSSAVCTKIAPFYSKLAGDPKAANATLLKVRTATVMCATVLPWVSPAIAVLYDHG